MADFRRKLLGFAGAVTMFSGMAFGQLCNTTNSLSLTLPATAANIRAEGQTELLPPLTLTCSTTGGASTFNVLVQIPNVSITSKVTSSSSGKTEIALSGGGASTVNATVSGGVATFTGVSVPASTAAGTLTFTISYIRVNASTLPSAGVFPTSITANTFVQGTTNTTSGTSSGSGLAVAYVFNALNNPTKVYQDSGFANSGIANGGAITGNANYAVCNANNSGGSTGSALPQFYVQVKEGFAGAFKTASDETGGGSAASSGTRVKLVFNNVPTGLNIFMPISVFSSNGAQITATSSETGSLSVPSASTVKDVSGLGLFAVPVSGTTATAIYEVTTSAPGFINTFPISVDLSAASNTITGYLANPTMTVTTSLAPQLSTAASQIPGFATTANDIVTANTVKFTPCNTNLLFPFVTNANGFETGIAISNTTKDPFSTANQSGTCTLNFYQSGVSGATNPAAVTAPNLAEGANQPYLAGEDYAFTLTQALGVNASNPATFQGYIIAQCNFSNAHAFAYILGGLQPGMFVNPNNTAMGYLAIVLNRGAVGSPESVTF